MYLNGIKLIVSTDFTATNGTSIVLASGAALNDTVDIVAYGTFQLNNTSIDALTDVSLGTPVNGQVLTFNSTSGDFEPQTPAPGRGNHRFALAMSIATRIGANKWHKILEDTHLPLHRQTRQPRFLR